MLMNGLSVGGIESRGIESEGMKLHLLQGEFNFVKNGWKQHKGSPLCAGCKKKNSTERPQSRNTGQPNLKLDLEA